MGRQRPVKVSGAGEDDAAGILRVDFHVQHGAILQHKIHGADGGTCANPQRACAANGNIASR